MKKIITLFNLSLLFANFLWAQNILSSDIKVEVKNESNVNSGALEYSPAFYENGIVFISDNKVNSKDELLDARIQKNTMSIFLSRRNEDGELGLAVPFAEEITTQFHEGPLTFNKTNDKIFFSRNDYLDGKTDKASNGVVKQIILSADMVGGKWTNLQELPFNDKEYDYLHPSINVDDNVLYFASDRPGGFGGFDLWKVEKSGDTWGEPINLGSEINTSENEVFPYIHADGMLFFSSNGHNGLGGGDIFFSKEYQGKFVAPVNLGTRFNTASDDFGFILDRDKRNGYFSSDRDGGKGQDDIYNFFVDETLGEDIFKFPENHPATIASNGAINDPNADGRLANANEGFGNKAITIFLADRLTGAEIDMATVEYVDLQLLTKTEIVTDQNGNIIQLISSENGEEVTLSSEEKAIRGLTDAEGSYILKIGDGNYLVNISKQGYKQKQVLVSVADKQDELLVLLDRTNSCTPIRGQVTFASNGSVAGSQVTVQEKGNTASLRNVSVDANGNFNLCLDCGKTFIITTNNGGKTTSKEINISADCNQGQTQQLVMDLDGGGLAGGTTIRLERIYYNFNDASIRPDARDELNALAELLKRYPSLEVEIASHTDARGTDSYNSQLSQRRADKVVAYLVHRGIDINRLSPVGYGERELLNQCSDGVSCTELDHQYNRRTEVRVKEFSTPVGVEYVANPPETIDAAPAHVSSGRKNVGRSGGRYQVIAGSFSDRNNANNRLSRVHQLGFSGAKIVRGSGIANKVVLVKTFSNYNQARTLADEIENVHNINTYVKRR
jgi:outer membrane protein OmpA-like peptidoglycan-associated protein